MFFTAANKKNLRIIVTTNVTKIPQRNFSIGIGNTDKQFEDPYFLLGVSRTEKKLKEIKKAYFHKAKKYHPDLNPDDDIAKQMFLKIQAAYRRIENDLDPELKA